MNPDLPHPGDAQRGLARQGRLHLPAYLTGLVLSCLGHHLLHEMSVVGDASKWSSAAANERQPLRRRGRVRLEDVGVHLPEVKGREASAGVKSRLRFLQGVCVEEGMGVQTAKLQATT